MQKEALYTNWNFGLDELGGHGIGSLNFISDFITHFLQLGYKFQALRICL